MEEVCGQICPTSFLAFVDYYFNNENVCPFSRNIINRSLLTSMEWDLAK